MANEQEHRGDEGLALEEARPELKEPAMYKVVLLNDDYTPMEFVVTLLERLFGLDRDQATRIMLLIHTWQGYMRHVHLRNCRNQGGTGE